MEFTDQIREFLAENFLFGPSDQIRDDESFLESGILDSTGVLQLVEFLEETYGIRVEDIELTPSNLDSIQSISGYLRRKLDGTSPRALTEFQNAGGR